MVKRTLHIGIFLHHEMAISVRNFPDVWLPRQSLVRKSFS